MDRSVCIRKDDGICEKLADDASKHGAIIKTDFVSVDVSLVLLHTKMQRLALAEHDLLATQSWPLV